LKDVPAGAPYDMTSKTSNQYEHALRMGLKINWNVYYDLVRQQNKMLSYRRETTLQVAL